LGDADFDFFGVHMTDTPLYSLVIQHLGNESGLTPLAHRVQNKFDSSTFVF
jgi:hypothetical protein